MGKSKKFRDVARDGRVAFVIDDVPQPGQVRGVEVRGRAEALQTGGNMDVPNRDPQMIRIRPTRIIGWGIDTDPYHPNSRSVPE
jgi:pyridoxamine 5'-phosphate oxidase family protein